MFQSGHGYKSFSILINFENFPPTGKFPFNRGRLETFLAYRNLKERETSKIVFYKVLTPKLFF